MVKITDIQNTVAAILKKDFKLKVYKNEVIEGFEAPCFFVSCVLSSCERANICTNKCTVKIEVTYFPFTPKGIRVRSEVENEKIMTALSGQFSPCVNVNDRFLSTSNSKFSFLGENNDILKYSFDLIYFDDFENQNKKPEAEKITQIKLKLETKKEGN